VKKNKTHVAIGFAQKTVHTNFRLLTHHTMIINALLWQPVDNRKPLHAEAAGVAMSVLVYHSALARNTTGIICYLYHCQLKAFVKTFHVVELGLGVNIHKYHLVGC
jgi:hypothetical protein